MRVFLVLLLLFCGCMGQISHTVIDYEKLLDMMDDDGVFLLNVYYDEKPGIDGTDMWIPADEFSDNLDRLPKDLNTTIIVYCRRGILSEEIAGKIADMGYESVYVLGSGVQAYADG
jgi:rhodanese-related sulfurtransferase